ncbi:MAG TPA: hypothetical protein VFI73_06915 [Candidatus Nitrosopolaris sp.]|nr:hypothetical protein [Candidatus Nitrosopolaris sp.]
MKEKDLKYLFIKSVQAKRIDGNDFFATKRSGIEIKIKDEGYFRNFDLVVAIIKRRNDSDIQFHSTDSYDNYANIIRRTGQLFQFARKEKCRIDWIRFFPVELKSDDDVLDDRLPNQILDAILTFGRAILVLDKKHSERAKLRGTLKLIPATVIGYTGNEDYFEVLSVYRRFISTSMLGLNKKRLVKLLMANNIDDKSGVYNCFENIQRICQKLVFNQIYDQDPGFAKEELEFIQKLANMKLLPEKKQITELIRQTSNFKITDYLY